MKGRYKRVEHELSPFETSLSSLPIDRPVAVYYRQSTAAQVGNISTYIQTIDIPSLLRAKGWQENKIILIDADEGVSGQTKIDEREGMKRLFSLITDGVIGTVACQDEDRLFRDITQIQVNIFIEACRKSRVLVLTPSITYDFAHPLMGPHHARQFRFKSEMAADYITTVIKGKLHAAKMRLVQEGRWVGGNVPLGFMVDRRKTLNGAANPNWGRYTEFEPYSRVVNQWFAIFNELNGNLRRTQITIQNRGLYPDLSLMAPEGFYLRKPLRQLPSTSALAYTLSCVSYIGHWASHGHIVRYNNHPAIVPIDQFMQAYNHIAEMDFEGQDNPHYRPFRDHAKPLKETDRGVERPLLSGLLNTPNGQDWATVGTGWDTGWDKYRYYYQPYQGVRTYGWSKDADDVDQKVCDLTLTKLQATFAGDTWAKSLQAAQQNAADGRHQAEQQLETLEATINGYLTSLSVLKTPELITEVENRYNEAKKERQRLQAQVASWTGKVEEVKGLWALRQSFTQAVDHWAELSREQKRQTLHGVIHWIEAHWETYQLRLVIHWRDGSEDTLLSRKIHGSGREWTADEDQLLAELVRGGADQLTIMAQLSSRTWGSILQRMRDTMPGEKRPRYKRVIDRMLSYEEYQRQTILESQSCSQSAEQVDRLRFLPTSCWWRR